MSCRWALQERPLMAFCRPGPLAYHYFIRVDSGNWVWVWVWSWACGGYWSCPWVKHLLNVDCVPGTWLVTVHTLGPLTFTMTPCGRCHWTSFTDARLRSLTTATRQGQPGIPPVPYFSIYQVSLIGKPFSWAFVHIIFPSSWKKQSFLKWKIHLKIFQPIITYLYLTFVQMPVIQSHYSSVKWSNKRLPGNLSSCHTWMDSGDQMIPYILTGQKTQTVKHGLWLTHISLQDLTGKLL